MGVEGNGNSESSKRQRKQRNQRAHLSSSCCCYCCCCCCCYSARFGLGDLFSSCSTAGSVYRGCFFLGYLSSTIERSVYQTIFRLDLLTMGSRTYGMREGWLELRVCVWLLPALFADGDGCIWPLVGVSVCEKGRVDVQ